VSFVHFQMVLVFGDICRETGGAHVEALPVEGSLVLQQKILHYFIYCWISLTTK